MMQRNYGRRMFGILIALLFFLGIIGNLKNENIVLLQPYFAMNQEAMEQLDDDWTETDRLLPMDNLQKSDFQVVVCPRRTNQSTEENACRTIVLFVMAAIVLFFAAVFYECLLHFGEKRIHIFHVITFIHQLDGKKRTPVLNK